MHETGKKLLNLMFRPGETICISPNKYGYHSIPLENAINGPVTMVPPDPKNSSLYPDTNELTMVALNPIKGFREDAHCTAYRNFLVEMDYGPLKEQLAYAKNIRLPYSAVIFSGNKSLHFLISLDKDLPSEEVYRKFSEWILSIATIADQLTKNPSRSIRVPGPMRDTGKRQALLESEFRGPTKLEDLVAWLKLYPDTMPKPKVKREPSDTFNFEGLKEWVVDRLINGLDPTKGRNIQWFSIACEFALSGYSESGTMDILIDFFTPDRDFKEREWRSSIKSGFKHIYNGK